MPSAEQATGTANRTNCRRDVGERTDGRTVEVPKLVRPSVASVADCYVARFLCVIGIYCRLDGQLTCAKRSCQTDIGTPIDRRHLSHTLWLRLQRYPVIHPCFSISILNDSGKRPTSKGACTYDFCQDVSNHILTSAKLSGC